MYTMAHMRTGVLPVLVACGRVDRRNEEAKTTKGSYKPWFLESSPGFWNPGFWNHLLVSGILVSGIISWFLESSPGFWNHLWFLESSNQNAGSLCVRSLRGPISALSLVSSQALPCAEVDLMSKKGLHQPVVWATEAPRT